ncbi:MAG TPA: signal peptidase I [Victivallales bacterium]|nr:signal peptidase I [Victivallales bacterium]
MDNYKSKFNTCVGPSMFPTLKSGDGLVIYDYISQKEMKVGDIILYPHPEKPFDVVHRIIKKLDSGVITRGDNNNKIDPYVIKYEDVIGKVISAKRKSTTIQMKSGRIGYILHRLLIYKKFSKPYIISPLSFVSCKITESKIFNFAHNFFNVQIISIKRNNLESYILKYKNKPIGQKSESTDNEWQIKFPYKLFINKNKL